MAEAVIGQSRVGECQAAASQKTRASARAKNKKG